MSQISVAVISLNTRDVLARCLESILRDEAARILVIDHGSTDGSVEMVWERFPFVQVHSDPSNPGYGAAVNHAMELTSEPYLLVLNSDTVLSPGSVLGLTERLDTHGKAAVIGPRLLNPDGSIQPSSSSFPVPYSRRSTSRVWTAPSPGLRECESGSARFHPSVTSGRLHGFGELPSRFVDPRSTPSVVSAKSILCSGRSPISAFGRTTRVGRFCSLRTWKWCMSAVPARTASASTRRSSCIEV